MKSYDLTVQPVILAFIIVIGKQHLDITEITVSFNDKNSLPTILKALDVCFHIFHVFNVKYPTQSEHIWLFMQIVIYNLRTKFDNIPRILDLAHKCQGHRLPLWTLVVRVGYSFECIEYWMYMYIFSFIIIRSFVVVTLQKIIRTKTRS